MLQKKRLSMIDASDEYAATKGKQAKIRERYAGLKKSKWVKATI